MTLTSLGFSFWKTEPIAPICQVYFNRCVDFCEMVRVKAAVLGLGLGDAQQLDAASVSKSGMIVTLVS